MSWVANRRDRLVAPADGDSHFEAPPEIGVYYLQVPLPVVIHDLLSRQDDAATTRTLVVSDPGIDLGNVRMQLWVGAQSERPHARRPPAGNQFPPGLLP